MSSRHTMRVDSLSPAGSECSTSTALSHADRKKETHLRCERQRREAINNGYSELKDLIPASMATMGCKTTNAAVLFRAAEYLQLLQNEVEAEKQELAQAESKIAALSMIAEQYESMSREAPQECTIQMQMMKKLLDDCYLSFTNQVNLNDYATITRSLIPWVETLEPQTKTTMENIIKMPFKTPRR
ncbi:unnamed protein product, partial [Mesorhabditis belari]|uniref:BHLH domain-containing protein n=1 Tax=Mesorhabditis belari TaxID=2138241 RepID=A0AAF3EA79_9BILA